MYFVLEVQAIVEQDSKKPIENWVAVDSRFRFDVDLKHFIDTMIGKEWCCFFVFIIKVDLSHSNSKVSRTRPCFASCFLHSDSPKTKKCCFNLKSQLQIHF